VTERTVNRHGIEQVINLLNDRGRDTEALKKNAGLDAYDEQARVPLRIYHRLLKLAASDLDDSTLGLTLAMSTPQASAYDLVGYLAMYSPTLGDAMSRVCRYSSLWAQGLTMSLESDGGQRCLCLQFDVPPADCWPHIQQALAGSVLVGKSITGGAWAPQRIETELPVPTDRARFQEILGTEVVFDRPWNRILFADGDWTLPVVTADANLIPHLQTSADLLLERLPAASSLVERVRAHLAGQLEGGDVSVSATSRALAMSSRTLQRRLQEEGVSYNHVLEEVRRELALYLLDDLSLDVTEASFRLGFAQPSGFHRAFKRWMGVAPSVYRRRAS
jgi:AraC-like DNA-binding protein